MTVPPNQSQIAELICLVYHEARNIRIPIRRGKVPEKLRFAALMVLSAHPDLAWLELSPHRHAASRAKSADLAASMFANRFHHTLTDLAYLFQQPYWDIRSTGGPMWANVAIKIWELIGTRDLGDDSGSTDLYRELLQMPVPSGRVMDRLQSLPR